MSSNRFENIMDAATLREIAAAKLARNPVLPESTRSIEEVLHELHVHQIELEMQNEELRRAQVELQVSRDHYADLYEFSPNSYLTLSCAGLINEINLAGAKLLGSERKKILNRCFASYVMPEYSDDWYLFFQRALKSDKNLSCEFSIKSADGSAFHVCADTQCQQIEGEIKLRIALTDISGRMQLEKQLQLEEFALDHAREIILLMDATQRYIYVNEEACRALGYSRDELLKLTPSDLNPDNTDEVVGNNFRKVCTDGTVRLETLFLRRDGSFFPVELQISDFDYLGQTIVMALARDITERKRHEEELIATRIILEEQNMRLHSYRETLEQQVEQRTAELNDNNQLLRKEVKESERSAERLSAMAANIPGFVFTIRVETDGHTSFPFTSSGVERLFGVSPADIREDARVLRTRYHPDDLPRLLDLMAETGRTLGLFHIEIRIANCDNHYVWIEIRSMPKRLPDGSTEWDGIMLDITARKQAQSEMDSLHLQLHGLLVHREEEREKERKNIAREIHDELGQILTGLQLNASILVREYATDSQSIRENLQESVVLTNKAMNVARNVAAALRPAELDAGIVAALQLQAKRFALVTGIQCQCTFDIHETRLNENVTIALYRIIQESFTNIARHAEAYRVDVNLKQDTGNYILRIRDNGIGFDVDAKKINSFGLLGIRERSLMLGGTCNISSTVGGTEIMVSIPERLSHD